MAKSLITALETLQKKGHDPVTADDLVRAYEILLGMKEIELTAIQNDSKQPMALRGIAEAVAGERKTSALIKVLEKKREERPDAKRLSIFERIENMKKAK